MNERFKKRLKIPIPAELILVVVGTIIAHYTHLNSRYGLGIIGPISTGFPLPRPPPMTSAASYVSDGILLGLVGFAMSVSMAKLMAERHRFYVVEILLFGGVS